jgi:tetratricopeptide (TPR) repeat protein
MKSSCFSCLKSTFSASLYSTILLMSLAVISPLSVAAQPQKINGLGSMSFPTSTKSAAAQTAFISGMLQLHLFEYANAEQAFQDAQKLDPDFAMAYWGEAMSATHPVWNQQNMKLGRAALAKLGATPQARADKAGSEKEKAWLAITDIMYGEGNKLQRDQKVLAAMKSMSEQYLADDEAQLFYALALLGVTQGERDIANFLKAAEVAKAVYARNPNHPGAAHYWIHGMDDPEHAGGALVAAKSLAKVAPSASHAQHMTAHIFMALGMWDQVVQSNESAIRVVREQALAKKIPVVADCGHYGEWLQYAYLQQGRLMQAQNLVDACRKESADAFIWYQAHPDKLQRITPAQFKARMARSLISMQAVTLIDAPSLRAKNLQVNLDNADVERDIGTEYFSYGLAAASINNLTMAEAALSSLKTLILQPPGKNEAASTVAYLKIMAQLLEASIEQNKGHIDRALELTAQAAADYDAIPFDFGPPATVKPPHELRGELLLAAGKPAEALVEFNLALKTAPNRAQAMLGRVHALQQSGDKPGSVKAAAELLAVWRRADATLAELNELRKIR